MTFRSLDSPPAKTIPRCPSPPSRCNLSRDPACTSCHCEPKCRRDSYLAASCTIHPSKDRRSFRSRCDTASRSRCLSDQGQINFLRRRPIDSYVNTVRSTAQPTEKHGDHARDIGTRWLIGPSLEQQNFPFR